MAGQPESSSRPRRSPRLALLGAVIVVCLSAVMLYASYQHFMNPPMSPEMQKMVEGMKKAHSGPPAKAQGKTKSQKGADKK